MIVGKEGPAVVLAARTCAWLERYAELSRLRVAVRGTDAGISEQLGEIRYAAMAWRGSATGTTAATEPELAAQSEQWLTTGQAADLLNLTDRGIRKAIADGRLEATEVGGRYRISREDLEHYRAARTA